MALYTNVSLTHLRKWYLVYIDAISLWVKLERACNNPFAGLNCNLGIQRFQKAKRIASELRIRFDDHLADLFSNIIVIQKIMLVKAGCFIRFVVCRFVLHCNQYKEFKMSIDVEVSCIEKRDRHNTHERIAAIGGVNPDGSRWKMLEDDAIAAIENRRYQFYVIKFGRKVYLIVASHYGRKYLKTEADDFAPNNLLSLVSCPL